MLKSNFRSDLVTAYHVSVLQISMAVLASIFCSYIAGRVHQWYRQSMERDSAFREGYNHASESLFPLAARSIQLKSAPRPSVPPVLPTQTPTPTRAFPPHHGRHSARRI